MVPQENNMHIEQFVMAYEVEQDRLRALLPEGFVSLRPVLRINAEIRNDSMGYLEYNTPVSKEGFRGWLNIAYWDNVSFTRRENSVVFRVNDLCISFQKNGLEGGCPAEKDNQGCYFATSQGWQIRLPETIDCNKEFCDCFFCFDSGAQGRSQGKTLPAYATEPKLTYPSQPFTARNASRIPCEQVLGTYAVFFEREGENGK